jgi:NDP-sugar pyrophosphorylase family protein
MKKKSRLTITLSQDLLKNVDATIDEQLIRNRSQAIEHLLLQSLGKKVSTAIILTGGSQTNQRCLKKINDRYLLSITIDHLKENDITNIIICGGKDNNKIYDIFEDGTHLGVNLQYVQELNPLGTAGAIKKAEKYITGSTFIVIHGDVLTNLNISDFIEFHKKEQTIATIGVKPRLGEKKYGMVSLQGNKIIKFDKSSANVGISIINTGLYVFDTKVLNFIPHNKATELEDDIFPLLVQNKELSAFVFQGIWHDISEKKDYDEAVGRW